ncbi:pentraxin-related protein PTX3 [Alosa sapidissima]|uniref:pentraxin-related protein PTX3 n=1 Tax=Alosa sapidissima TaxID=34773 RepID=UPI001C092707|nr:pentraxin-related protein PTX3 [Alosa sapidissima]
MLLWRLLRAVCLGCLPLAWAQGYDDDMDIMPSYVDAYYNEISEGDVQDETPSTVPPTGPPSECKSTELTKWDKLFTMLENSQMKENMLLQYSDDIMKVELQSLRGEMLQFVARYGSACAGAIESTGRRATALLEQRLQQALEQMREAAGRERAQHEAALQQLLGANRGQAARLAKLESACLSGRAGGAASGAAGEGSNDAKGFQSRHLMQATAASVSAEARLERSLERLTGEVHALREQMERQLLATTQNSMPAGCDSAVFIPMQSAETYAQLEQRNVRMSALTVCLWARPTQALNKTVLFSYGGAWNPIDVQLVLSGRGGALFTVGGEAHLVEASGVAEERRWTHLCGTWSSEQGLASLWVDGLQVASAPGVAEGNVIPGSGVLQLGQEGARQRRGTMPLDGKAVAAAAAFTGKITGVNVWDRTLSQAEISQQAKRNGSTCGSLGNVVAWGVTKIVLRGDAKLIY